MLARKNGTNIRLTPLETNAPYLSSAPHLSRFNKKPDIMKKNGNKFNKARFKRSGMNQYHENNH